MKKVCSWCMKVIVEGPAMPLSHGTCKECIKKLLEADAALERKRLYEKVNATC